MMILSYIVLILSVIETRSDESESSIPLPEIVQFVNNICSSIDECKLPCCQLNEIYSTAKNRCSTNIDGQLSEVDWVSPFSAAHTHSCESLCPQNISNNEERLGEQLLQSSDDAEASEDLCSNFTNFCYNYSADRINEFAALDFFWGVFVPVSAMGLAITLMIFTLFLYLAVPSLRCRIQDKCFLFYLSSRIIYVSEFIVLIFYDFDEFMCVVAAFIHQFSGLASEFWLNVICFHLWRCIRSVIPPYQSSAKTISLYSLYAWGCSLLVTVMTHVADLWLPTDSNFRPGIGEETCTIKSYDDSKGSQWFYFQPKFIYFYSITIVTQIINLCAFLHIAYTISSKNKVFKNKDNGLLRRHQIKTLGILAYLKLFLVMGLIRLLDMTFLHFGQTNMAVTTGCVLNGVFVTVIFVFNKRVFQLGKNRFSRRSTFSQTIVR